MKVKFWFAIAAVSSESRVFCLSSFCCLRSSRFEGRLCARQVVEMQRASISVVQVVFFIVFVVVCYRCYVAKIVQKLAKCKFSAAVRGIDFFMMKVC